MELRKLEFLLDLAETENYSETAERMFTTQGNVSKQILALEKELGAYDRFVAVLPANDPLAERTEISLKELEDRHFLLLDEKTELFSKAQKLCLRAGFEPNVAYQGVRIDTIVAMTANGLGVSLLMDRTIPEKKEEGIIKIALKETCESRLLFVRRKGRKGNPAVNVFWEFLKKEYKSVRQE